MQSDGRSTTVYTFGETIMRLVIGNDHAAVEMKKEIKEYLESKGIEMVDVGTISTESFHYPIAG